MGQQDHTTGRVYSLNVSKGLAAKAPVTDFTPSLTFRPNCKAQVIMSETLTKSIQALPDKRQHTLICTMYGVVLSADLTNILFKLLL
ncbi:hypothetical protein PKOR_14485 [Pontibacter korlensis]|uniref:Uncharacterized protein n=1 Tax=Pontibacter korlensis TaxID=400092 RepID=A0A0E3ZHG9_9BACT|nr:hypothetical protein PKOR_14485 [Pontibacter korlensis]